MRHLLLLCAAMLCLSGAARADDTTSAVELNTPAPAAEPAAPLSLQLTYRQPWQFEMGYQFQHFSAAGIGFHDNGFHTDMTRYLNDWFGIEGMIVMGFGNNTMPGNHQAKSLFLGGGPHVAWRNSTRIEPWGHFHVGDELVRVCQSGLTSCNSGFAFVGGGGIDYKLNRRFSVRGQVDYIGTRFNSKMQSNFSIGSGLVVNF